MKIKNLTAIAIIIMIAMTSCNNGGDYQEVTYFTMNGDELERPKDYRKWVFVGTPTTPNDMNNGKAAFPEFHNVYIDPLSYKEWKATGEWREGTILVKELVSVGTKSAASGNGYFMGDFIGLEATIKSKKHFPNEPGNWSYFSFTTPKGSDLKKSAKAFGTNDCNSCHAANAQDDFVFTQHYPVLRAAMGIGEDVVPENSAVRKSTSKVDIWAPTAPTPEGFNMGIPLEKEALFTYLKSGDYKNFKHQEKDKHPSQGPHTQVGLPVKVFMTDMIASSLAANREQHDKGAGIVKEMFNKEGELAGWAVMVKTQEDTEAGLGWFWYEVTSTTDSNAIAAMGNGVQGCISCHHTGGRDFVRTSFPFNQ